MMDRMKSLVDGSSGSIHEHLIDLRQAEDYEVITARMKTYGPKLRKEILRYKQSTKAQSEQEAIKCFQSIQKEFRSDQHDAKAELDRRKSQKNKGVYNQIKQSLLKAVEAEMKLDIELSELMQIRKQKLEEHKSKLLDSKRIAYAIQDIQDKLDGIRQLEAAVEECLYLLKLLGVLVLEQGESIDVIEEHIKRANQDIKRTQKNIEQAIRNSNKSRKKMCWIILISVVVIALILGVLFGLKIVGV